MNRIHQRTFVFQSHAKLSISFIFEYTALSHSLQLTNRISTIAARISCFLIGSGLSLQLILNHSSFIYPPHWANTFCYTKKRRSKDRRFALALSIFPGRRQPSIVDRNELNYRVRNGNGWTLILISTNSMSSSTARKQTILYCFASYLSRPFSDLSYISIEKPASAFRDGKGKAAEGISFRACAEANDPQLALTW